MASRDLDGLGIQKACVERGYIVSDITERTLGIRPGGYCSDPTTHPLSVWTLPRKTALERDKEEYEKR